MRFALLLLVFVVGCATRARAPAPSTAPPPSQGDARKFDVDLDEATVAALLTVVERATEKSMLIDRGAQHVVSCTIVSLRLHQATASLLVERVTAALRLKGLILDMQPHDGGGTAFRVALDPSVLEPQCPGDVDPNVITKAPDDDTPVDVAVINAEIIQGIRTISPTSRTITKHARDLILEHFAVLFTKLRLVPEQENGSVIGIRAFGIRPDSVLAALGIENGDRLLTINGKSIASPDQALEAYAGSRDSKVIDIALWRVGKTMHVLVRTID